MTLVDNFKFHASRNHQECIYPYVDEIINTKSC